MAKITKQSFEYFKGVYELKCGWTVEDDYYEEVITPQLDLMKMAMIRAEFMFKCLYKGEKPLSKEDYSRTRFTHRKLWSKYSTLSQVQRKSHQEAFERNMRKLKISKGVYPLGLSFEEALKDEEIKKYYEKGTYKKGSFVAKCIAPLHYFIGRIFMNYINENEDLQYRLNMEIIFMFKNLGYIQQELVEQLKPLIYKGAYNDYYYGIIKVQELLCKELNIPVKE